MNSNEAMNFVVITDKTFLQGKIIKAVTFLDFGHAQTCAKQSDAARIIPFFDLREVLTGQRRYDEAIKQLERGIYQTAINEAGGSVTAAARLLGMSHQTLLNRLKGIKDIKRNPVIIRRKHLMKHPTKGSVSE